MLNNLDEMQNLGKDNVDVAMKCFDAMSKGFQAIATEVGNYSTRSLEDYTAAVGKLLAARTPERAIEVQGEYVKAAYEGFVAQATRIGERYSDLMKASYQPLEGVIGKRISTT